ncbi:MAG: hypothetical protein EAZ87_16245 [Nostocales cyanobacterium]|nr:MAG: hypothetical protein EAZ87_16245 [Nostocales cyanobacterium]
MMKFTVKGLIALFVTSSVLFLTPIRSNAQVNMKTLAEVAKSCQKDVPSKKYYQQMLVNVSRWNNTDLVGCIGFRYHYSLILDKFPELASAGEILPGYPASVAVAQLAVFSFSDQIKYLDLLDCIIANNTFAKVCRYSNRILSSQGMKYRTQYSLMSHYLPYICPSCVVTHDEVFDSQESILKAFIEWFIRLDKSQRRKVISILGDDNQAFQLRQSLGNETEAAQKKYEETRASVQQQEQERRRQELLGN